MGLIFKAQGKAQDYLRFLAILVSILFFVGGVFAYFSTEVNTNLYSSDFTNIAELCANDRNPDLKYFKVISYEKSLHKATIYCIYEDYSKNIELQLNFMKNKWEPYLTTKLNKDSNFYWPIYV